MKQVLIETLILILLIVATFLWTASPLERYTASLLGLLFFAYLIYPRQKRQFKQFPIWLLSAMTLLLILSSGGLNSSLFFLIYFISFVLAFLLRPEMAFVFSAALFIAFLPQAMQGDITANFIKLFSLLLLSPLAYFFGRELRARNRREKETKEAAQKIQEDVSDVVKSEGMTLQQKNVEKLADIIKQSRQLEKGAKE